TKTTTKGKSHYGVIIVAWLGALLICGGIAYLLMQENGGSTGTGIFTPVDQKSERKAIKPRTQRVKKPSNARKEQQKTRPLPKEHADQMAAKAEQATKMQLRSQLQRFQQMVDKMREHSNAALDRVEQRQLPTGAPRDANDVSAARNIPQAG